VRMLKMAAADPSLLEKWRRARGIRKGKMAMKQSLDDLNHISLQDLQHTFPDEDLSLQLGASDAMSQKQRDLIQAQYGKKIAGGAERAGKGVERRAKGAARAAERAGKAVERKAKAAARAVERGVKAACRKAMSALAGLMKAACGAAISVAKGALKGAQLALKGAQAAFNAAASIVKKVLAKFKSVLKFLTEFAVLMIGFKATSVIKPGVTLKCKLKIVGKVRKYSIFMDLKAITKIIQAAKNFVAKIFGKIANAAKNFINNLKKKLGMNKERMETEFTRVERLLTEDERALYMQTKEESILELEQEEEAARLMTVEQASRVSG